LKRRGAVDRNNWIAARTVKTSRRRMIEPLAAFGEPDHVLRSLAVAARADGHFVDLEICISQSPRESSARRVSSRGFMGDGR